MSAHIHDHTHTCIYTHTHAQKRNCAHVRTSRHTYTHTHTYKHAFKHFKAAHRRKLLLFFESNSKQTMENLSVTLLICVEMNRNKFSFDSCQESAYSTSKPALIVTLTFVTLELAHLHISRRRDIRGITIADVATLVCCEVYVDTGRVPVTLDIAFNATAGTTLNQHKWFITIVLSTL